MNFNPPGPGPNALLTQATEVYDVFGNRVEEDVWTSSGTTFERFAYDGPSQTLEAALDGSDAVQTRYLNGAAVDQVLAEIGSTGTVAWLLTDHLGSTRAVVNDSGVALDQITYDPYGNVTAETNPSSAGLVKYTGQIYDAATGL